MFRFEWETNALIMNGEKAPFNFFVDLEIELQQIKISEIAKLFSILVNH